MITTKSGIRIIPIFAAAWLMIQSSGAQHQPAPVVLEYAGTTAPAREAEVAPRHDGLLLKINFSAGQLVKQGDLLFEFEATDKEPILALARATLRQAEAQLRLAEVKVENMETLRARNVSSKMQMLEAEAQRDLAAANVDGARANVQLAEITLKQMKLYAPISGIISRPLAKEGAYVTKQALDQSHFATIVQLDPIHVVSRAPAAMYFQRVELNKSLEQGTDQLEFGLVLPTGDKHPHKGRLVATGYEFDRATQTVEATVEFPNPNLLLRPGLNVILQSSLRAK
jgi:RND family efflux transporter MFP subunit